MDAHSFDTQPEVLERFPVLSQEALEAWLILEGHDEESSDNVVQTIKMIQAMVDTERITKVEMLIRGGENTDIGRPVSIRMGTVKGTLNDVFLDGRRNHYLSIDGLIYQMNYYDLIIVDNPKIKTAEQWAADLLAEEEFLEHAVSDEAVWHDAEVARIARIEVKESCTEVYFYSEHGVDGELPFCSKLEYQHSLSLKVPSLRLQPE